MHADIIDELFVWRLVLDKVVSYSELDNLNYIDALKLNMILDFKSHLAEKERSEKEKQMRSKNGNKS